MFDFIIKINSFIVGKSNNMGNCIDSGLNKTFKHDQLGQLQRQYHQNQSIQFFKSSIKLNSIEKFEKWSSQIKKMKFNVETKDFLCLPKKVSLNKNDIFQNTSTLSLYYEPYIQTLEDLIKRYRNRNYRPSEEMIWYLIYSLTKVGKYFEKISKKIGNLKPSNILISRNRQIKLVGEKSSLFCMSAGDQIRLMLNDSPLLAPQQICHLNTIQDNRQLRTMNPQFSQVYSAGIIALSVAHLIQPKTLYNYNFQTPSKSIIDFSKIQSLLVGLKKNRNFSALLAQTIEEMIQVQHDKRIRSGQLFKRLSGYQNEILSKKGLNYSNEELQKIKSSLDGSQLNGSLANGVRNGTSNNNSLFTNGSRSLNNNKHQLSSFRVSDISSYEEYQPCNSQMQIKDSQQDFNNQKDFVNIL